MVCDHVGREEGAWRCRGGGDAVDGNCCGRAAEDVSLLSRCALFEFERELMGAEGCPRCVPCLLGARKDIPVRELFGEAARVEERAGADCGEPHVGDGKVCIDGLLLSVLKAVDLLGDAQVVGPPAEHGRQEGDNVGGLEAAADVLEAVEEVAEGDLVLEVRFLLEGEDPRFLDNSLEECAPGAFDGFDKPLELDLGGPEAFGLGADSVGRVSGNAVVIVLEGGFHAVERPPHVIGLVVVVGEEDIGEADLAAWDIDRLEDVDEGLIEVLEVVGVERTDDKDEGRLGLCEEIFCILGGGHGADNEEGVQGLARRSSWEKSLN